MPPFILGIVQVSCLLGDVFLLNAEYIYPYNPTLISKLYHASTFQLPTTHFFFQLSPLSLSLSIGD